MATLASETRVASGKVGILRFALTGALAAITFFILCWLGGFLPFGSLPHMYVQLFTNAQINSGLALFEGLCWSLVFGLIAGAVIALSYKLVAAIDGR